MRTKEMMRADKSYLSFYVCKNCRHVVPVLEKICNFCGMPRIGRFHWHRFPGKWVTVTNV